jgi:hypothetical protein
MVVSGGSKMTEYSCHRPGDRASPGTDMRNFQLGYKTHRHLIVGRETAVACLCGIPGSGDSRR